MATRRKADAQTIGFAEFKATLTDPSPPKGLAPAVEALWFAANGLWERAHAAAQKRDDTAGAWVHAYLHRMEGDEDNARLLVWPRGPAALDRAAGEGVGGDRQGAPEARAHRPLGGAPADDQPIDGENDGGADEARALALAIPPCRFARHVLGS